MRILALVPGGIGDQILFFPTLDDLKQSYPNAQIDVVVEPQAMAAYRVCPSVREVIRYDFKDVNGPADWGNLLGIIRDREYDVALSVGRSGSVNFLLWMTGIPTRIGFGGGWQGWFLTQSIPIQSKQPLPEVYHSLLKGLDLSSPCPPLSLRVPKADLQWADAEQLRLGVQDTGYILIHGGANQQLREPGIEQMYPAKKWQVILDDLQKRQPNLPVVILKGLEDQEVIAQLRQTNPNLKVTAPQDVGKIAAMIAGANLMLSTDGIPLYLAAAVGTYTIGLFGPTQATQVLPSSERLKVLQSSTQWVADIPPEAVLKQVWGE